MLYCSNFFKYLETFWFLLSAFFHYSRRFKYFCRSLFYHICFSWYLSLLLNTWFLGWKNECERYIKNVCKKTVKSNSSLLCNIFSWLVYSSSCYIWSLLVYDVNIIPTLQIKMVGNYALYRKLVSLLQCLRWRMLLLGLAYWMHNATLPFPSIYCYAIMEIS